MRGAEGGPPYLVRWSGDAHETLVFPGPDAVVQQHENDGGGRPGGDNHAESGA